MKEAVEFNWAFLGAKLAALDDNAQAAFFHGFARELEGYESHYRREFQMLAAMELIPESSRKTLGEYLPCLWFKEGV